MNWDQIETNWMAMTRRIRPERPKTNAPSAEVRQNAGDMAETVADWAEGQAESVVSVARSIA